MSRIAKRRLRVLLLVQLLLVLHVMLWWLSSYLGWFDGFTISPIEPSESIETVSDGIINAGAIFFATALLSTIVLGRWFCGWGCHVLLLQDGCLWMMRKIGIRPHAFRSRLLMLGPLALALYMFVWPLFYRFAIAPFTRPDLSWPGFSSHVLVRDFWATFPGVTVAIVFLAICGFATIYTLGGKGFCTYGCPYGGFFAPLDRLAPLRIRVSDACRGCGECTAVCTSNVRVHEEVATHGMVIDSGCMKTMDCIEACPNDALSMGFGSVAVGKPRPRRKWDLTWAQECVLGVLMVALFLAWRGALGVVPMLMAMGMAAVGTWLLWKTWRMLRDANAKWLRVQLKRQGRMQREGAMLLIGAVLFAGLSLNVGMVQAASWRGWSLSDGLIVPVQQSLLDGPVRGDTLAAVDAALDAFSWTQAWTEGGIAIVQSPKDRYDRAQLLVMQGDLLQASEQLYVVTLEARPDQKAWRDYFAVQRLFAAPAYSQQWAEGVLEDHPYWTAFRADVVDWLLAQGRGSEAIGVAKGQMDLETARFDMLRAIELLQEGRAVQALPFMAQYVKNMPADTLARASLARLYQALGHYDRAQEHMQRAIDEGPGLPPAQQQALAEEVHAFNAMVRDQ
jgi:tetratricopeptide (TPR) repeat protein/ferredoxin